MSSSNSSYCFDNFLYNLVYEYLKTVSDELAEEFYDKYFFYDDPNLPVTTVQEVVKKYYDEHNCERSDPFYEQNSIRNTSNDDEVLLNSIVYQYLKTVSDEWAEEFKEEFFIDIDQSGNSQRISIQEVVKKYSNDAICKNSENHAKPVKIKSKERSIQTIKNFKTRIPKKTFTADEDKVLFTALQSDSFPKDEVKLRKSKLLKDLMKSLKRDRNTVLGRLKKLQVGSSRRANKPFGLLEDKLIVDEAIGYLDLCRSLKMTFFPNNKKNEEFAISLKRNSESVRGRWNTIIRPWLLQYYNKTLNLEIKPMLANSIADNFESVEKIDWGYLTTFSEFMGHTEDSLRVQFKTTILSYKRKFKETNNSLISLRKLAKYVSGSYKPKKVSKAIERRQQELIEYFEEQVKIHNIKDFL